MVCEGAIAVRAFNGATQTGKKETVVFADEVTMMSMLAPAVIRFRSRNTYPALDRTQEGLGAAPSLRIPLRYVESRMRHC